VASAAVGIAQGAYSIAADSAAVGAGNAAAPGTPNHDFYGQTRSTSGVSIGAVEFPLPAPTLTAITPNSGVQGTTVSVTLTGTNFTAGSNVVISGTGVTQFGATFSPTSITTNFVIAANATLGARTVTVGTSGGTSAGVTFTVVAKPTTPTLTSISPITGTRGNTVAVTLTGTNFSAAGLAVNLSRTFGTGATGVTVTNLTFVNSTTVTANFVIDANAPLVFGVMLVNVSVTTAGGTTGNQIFTVTNPALATLTSISPTSGARGTTVAVTFTGTNFTTAGSSINISGQGATAATQITPTITSATSTQLVVSFVIGSGVTTGSHFVSVTTPRNTTVTRTFTVN
jgi:Quinohemoprotein amine dehydrogenase, alpha subunit domain III/IPT/TIG domain